MRVVLLAIFSALVLCIQGEAINDLATLATKFQLIINELGERADNTNAYETEIAAMLQRLEQFHTPQTKPQNVSIDWFVGSFAQAIPMRMVLVVSSFEGMYLNSGIGTFYSSLADFLVAHGHIVTILYTQTEMPDTTLKNFKRWQASYEKRGILVVRLPPPTVHVTSPKLTQTSYRVYQYLRNHEQEFDVVHFPDWEGPGYFSVLAKHQGLAFASKVMIVGLHGPWRWVKHGNQQPALTQVEDVETDWLERRSVELADVVVTPSADLPRWLAAQGWAIPGPFSEGYQGSKRKLIMMPFLPGKEIYMVNQKSATSGDRTKIEVKELVYFGRMEVRKGVVLFADALDNLIATSGPESVKSLKVTFLGRGTSIENQQSTIYLEQRAKLASWPFKVNYITHKDRKGALEYLKEDRGRLAVIPSLVDNAPYTLYECLYAQVPFIASDLPSIVALIHPESRASVLFTPNPANMAEKLQRILNEGAVVSRGMNAEEAVKAWISFYDMVSSLLQEDILESPQVLSVDSLPTVSVCITYFNRPQLLPMAIQSVLEQDYPSSKIEIVVIDDGSTNADAVAYINNLRERFEPKGWQVLRTENKYLGAARNTAARAARGEYILFLDDDNLANSKQVSTYVSVARKTGADVLTAAHDVFSGTGIPDLSSNTNVLSRSVPLGPAVAVGIFKNCFGDANFFISRHAFTQAGGFTEERGVGQEDHEFLAKVVLSGLKLEAIPESLLYYRMHNKSEQMIYNTNPVKNQVRSTRPYASILDPKDPEASNLLKVLAHKRVRAASMNSARGVEAVCNMSVTGVQPSEFSTVSQVNLTFNTTAMDCPISSVLIGSDPCENIVIESSTSFQCTTPKIFFPDTYSISITYGDRTKLYTGEYVTVTQAPSATSAVVVMTFTADPALYSLQALIDLLAKLGGIDPSSITELSHVITQFTKRSVSTQSEEYESRFSIISTSPTATDVVQIIEEAIPGAAAQFDQIGVTPESFGLMADCDSTGQCACAPNYAPPTCETKALCPNNCTSNGECVDGNLGRVCSCMDGYAGRDCSTLSCPNDCSGQGSCNMESGAAPECQCETGWEGAACNISVPCPNNCTGYGTCDGGFCTCESGHTGGDCSGTASEIVGGATTQAQQKQDNTVLGVVIAVVGVIFLVAVGLVVYIVIERRRR